MRKIDTETLARERARLKAQRRRWRAVIISMVLVVAAATSALLILPAVTMSGAQMLLCSPEVHTHDASCLDAEGNVICGYADFVVHTHTAECYDEEGRPVCPLPEIEAHTHSSECYGTELVAVCGKQESAVHVHTAECYTQPEPELICTLAEGEGHVHTDECYVVTEVLTCTLAEDENHTHGAECYAEERQLVCTLAESEPHVHTADCYAYSEPQLTCGMEEQEAHTHTEECYEERPVLTCTREEIILHTHSAGCFDAEGNLVCGQIEVLEHVHDASCFPPEPVETPEPTDAAPEAGADPNASPEPTEGLPEPTLESPEPTEPVESAEPTDTTEPEPTPILNDGTSWATAGKVESAPRMMLFAANALSAAPAGSYDFTNSITSMTVEKLEGGAWVAVAGSVTSGQSIRVTLRYTLPTGVVTVDKRNIHYQLPSGISLSETAYGSVINEDTGEVIGDYTISADGLIVIEFTEAFAAGGESVAGALQFRGTVSATGGDGDDTIDLGAAGGTIYVEQKVEQTDISVGKVGNYYKDASMLNIPGLTVNDGDLVYVIYVRTENGTHGGITVTDRFTAVGGNGTVSYDRENMVIAVYSPDGRQDVWTWNEFAGHGISVEYMSDGDHPVLKVAGLPRLEAGWGYELYYTATPTWYAVGNGYAVAQNEAAASDGLNSASANATVYLSGTMVYKSGSYDVTTGNISWRVVINEDFRDLSGWQFVDTLTVIGTGGSSQYDLKNYQNFKIEAYGRNEDGTWKYEGNLTDEIHPLLTTVDGRLSFTFPTSAEPYDSIYLITYETPLPDEEPGTNVTLRNTAQIGDYSHTYDLGITIPDGESYYLVKELTDSSLHSGELSWTSIMVYPQGSDAAKLVYYDWIQDAAYADGTTTSGSHYTTLRTLIGNFGVYNARGYAFDFGTEYTLKVLYLDDVGAISSANQAEYLIYNGKWSEVTSEQLYDDDYLDRPIVMFAVGFTDAETAQTKLDAGQALGITYKTVIDKTKVEQNKLATFRNHGLFEDAYYYADFQTTFQTTLDKQVSATGESFGSYTDAVQSIDLGDSGGIIHYRIMLYDFDSDTGGETLTDTLGPGMELVEGSVQLYRQSAAGGEPEKVDNTNSYYLSYTTEETANGTKINFTLSRLTDHENYVLGIYYEVSVADDPAWANVADGGTLTYTNTVSWNGKTDSTSTTVVNTKPTVTKTAEMLLNEAGQPLDIVRYAVDVNPQGLDLVPNQNTIKLSDQIETPAGTEVRLRLETVKVYAYDASQPDNIGAALSAGSYSVSYDEAAGTIEFTLPDSTACVVVYEYEIDRGSAATDYTIRNTVYLEGQATISAGDDIVIEYQDSSATANKATLRIYKTDASNAALLLPGAEFLLERYEPTGDGGYAWHQSALTADGEHGHYIVHEKGYIELSFAEYVGQNSLYNTLYRLTETTAPAGYAVDPTPHYFVWKENGYTDAQAMAKVILPADLQGKLTMDDITFIPYSHSEQISVPNTPTSLTVSKLWRSEAGGELTPTVESVTVTLKQWKNGALTGKKFGAALTAENGWSHTWLDLPLADTDGTAYTYTVEEDPVAGFEATYSVNNEGSGITTGELVITNTETTGYVLPETGGMGVLVLALAGITIIATFGAGLALLRVRKKGR